MLFYRNRKKLFFHLVVEVEEHHVVEEVIEVVEEIEDVVAVEEEVMAVALHAIIVVMKVIDQWNVQNVGP